MKILKSSNIQIFKYVIIALAVIVAAWILPALYELVSPRTDRLPFVVYSCLDSTFIRFETSNKQVRYIDFRGQEFTKSEADSLLPLFAFRQLVAEGRLPDSLFGVELTPKKIQQNSFHFKTSPKQLNKPAVGLYTMLESASGRVDLQLPPDVFRLTADGLEFIDCETNRVNKAKSLSFSRELTKHGFTFPVALIWGNGSTRKDYDNGFLLTDANNRLFQLKMVKGAPWVREITNPLTPSSANPQPRYIQLFTIEPANRKLVGLVVTDDYRLLAVRSNGTLAEIGAINSSNSDCPTEESLETANGETNGKMSKLLYDPQTMQITIVGDLFHWTITLYTANDSRYYAVNADTFEQVACEIVPDPELPLSQRIKRWIMPVRLHFTSWQTQLIQPTINND